MTEKEYFERMYSKMVGITAVCKSNTNYNGEEYPNLEIGKTYVVEYSCVLRSSHHIMLKDDETHYSSHVFDIYDGEKLIPNICGDERFWAPYLRAYYRSRRVLGIKNYDTLLFVRSHILPALLKLEQEHNIRILLAVESGSRAWGFASEDSDWDIRFIYVHLEEWYLGIDEKRDTIEYYDPETDLDMSGWDLKKALSLFRKSNPSMMEWFHSPIMYYHDDKFLNEMLELEKQYFNPVHMMYHYYRIYMKQNERYLSKDGFSLKKFLYYLRGILACRWIERESTLPPVDFRTLYTSVCEDDIVAEIDKLIEKKRQSKESDKDEVGEPLMSYSKNLADYYSEIVGTYRPEMNLSKDATPLNQLMVEIVKT